MDPNSENVRKENEENVNKDNKFSEDHVFLQPPVPDRKLIEKREEEKLKSKYPMLAGGGRGGGSALLNKRLHKGGQKYFDSGDYAMAKAKLGGKAKVPLPPEVLQAEAVGETIPTPENIQARKPSLVPSNLVAGKEQPM